MAEPLENARPMPHTLRRNMNDGVYRFSDESAQMAVIKEGESYYIVDYDTRYISNPLAVSDVNRVLKQVRDGASAHAATESVTTMQESTQMPQTVETSESAVNTATNERLALANQGKKRYNKRVPSGNDFVTNAMIWAHSAGVAVGERRTLTDGEITVLIEKTTDGYTEIKTVSNYHSDEIANMIKEVETDNGKLYETLYSSIEAYETDGQRHSLRGGVDVGEARNDRSNGGVYQDESRSNGNNATPGSGANQRKLETATNSSNQNRADFLETKAIDAWAKENVPDYNKLAENARLAVRATIRRARAHGIAEADIKR